MKIKKATIENYLSLKEVKLSFDNFTVLIGKNGSGKTGIMEALYRFFTDFSTTEGTVSDSLSDYHWFRRDSSKPIRISIELELTDEDLRKIFQKLPTTPQLYSKEQLNQKGLSLKVSRRIDSLQSDWKTEYLDFNGIILVKDDEPIEPEDLSEILFSSEEDADITEELLDDEELLNDILTNITNMIKGKFKFIPAARDEKFRVGTREPIIDSSLLSAQTTLSLSTEKEKEIKWSIFRKWVEYFLGKRIESSLTKLLVAEDDLRLPVQFLGGGQQEIFALMWHLLDEGFIYGIEEPENHLHPEYLRKLFRFLKEISDKRQIIISTHSPILVDKTIIKNNWLVKLEDGETKVQRIEKKEDLKLILAELGLVPSDIYLKDFVLFVEGGTEKEAIVPILAEKLGFKELIDRVAVISIGGEGQLKNYLKIWKEELQNIIPIEYTILLDSHSKHLILNLIKDLKIDAKKFIILEKGSIEDYYPIELVVKALRDLFDIEVKPEDIDQQKPRDKEIERILKEHDKIRSRWKIEVGEYVTSRLSEDQIPKEIRSVFEMIKEQLRT